MPRLGFRAVLILGGWGLACIGLSYLGFAAASSAHGDGAEPGKIAQILSGRMWLVGVSYGIAVGVSWMASASADTYIRSGLRLGIVVALALLVNQFATSDWFRNLSSIGGVVTVQCILFFLLRVPPWTAAEIPAGEAEQRRRRQFGTAEVVIATTAIAMLLAIMLRYAPPVEPLEYWLVMMAVWWLCPLIAACLFFSALSTNHVISTQLVSAAAVIATGLVWGMSFAEYLVTDPPPKVFAHNLGYVPFALGLLSMLAGFAVAARASAAANPRGGQSAASPDP